MQYQSIDGSRSIGLINVDSDKDSEVRTINLLFLTLYPKLPSHFEKNTL